MPPNIMKAADMAIDQVDWTKVHNVMDHLDWRWAGLGNVPDYYDLRKKARSLCASCYFECRGKEAHTGTGGIHVDYYKEDEWFTVSFVLDRGEGSTEEVLREKEAPF